MADVAECIAKLSAAGKISGKIADEAPEFFQRSEAELFKATTQRR
jgi:hypothetical protein